MSLHFEMEVAYVISSGGKYFFYRSQQKPTSRYHIFQRFQNLHLLHFYPFKLILFSKTLRLRDKPSVLIQFYFLTEKSCMLVIATR